MHDYADVVAVMRGAVDQLDDRGPMPARDRILLWQELRAVRMDLDIVYRDVETDATDALVGLLRDSDDDTLETVLGVVHVGVSRRGSKWNGYRLLGKLARDVRDVDPATGELIALRAVPLDVLRDVVPSASKDEWTSQTFLLGGLKRYDVDPSPYLERGTVVEVIRAGAPR